MKPHFLVMAIVTIPFLTGCLGQRYESNVPAADLELWDDQEGVAVDSGAGKPRFIQNRGSQPGYRGSLPGRSTLPRGTWQRGTRPNRGSLPNFRIQRGSLPLRRGTLPGMSAPRGTLPGNRR